MYDMYTYIYTYNVARKAEHVKNMQGENKHTYLYVCMYAPSKCILRFFFFAFGLFFIIPRARSRVFIRVFLNKSRRKNLFYGDASFFYSTRQENPCLLVVASLFRLFFCSFFPPELNFPAGELCNLLERSST